MSTVAGVVVGTRVRSRGRVGEVTAVDEARSLVTIRYDDAKLVNRSGVRDEALSEQDSVVGSAEVEVLPVAARRAEIEALREELRKPDGRPEFVKAPTQAQITAARRAALEKGRAEGLGAKKLMDVQDEAEAELVSRLARGEAA